MRLQDDMKVIGHDDPRKQLVAVSNTLAVMESRYERGGGRAISQPARTPLCAVELAIVHYESFSWLRIFKRKSRSWPRERSCQTPRDKNDGAVGNAGGFARRWRLKGRQEKISQV
jgi:hypothetical protein